jgi:MFS family permease
MTIAARAGFGPKWYHGWNIVGVCVLSQVASLALTLNCFSLFLRDWTHEFKVPVSAMVLSVTLFSLVTAGVAPLAGAAIDRFPARWVFGSALVGLVIFHVSMGFTTAAWQIVALYAVLLPFAICFGATIPAQAVVSRWFVRRVGLAMGITAFGLAAAGVVFPSLIVWLLPMLGWRRVWWMFAGVIGVIILPAVLGVMRDRPRPEDGLHYVGERTVNPDAVKLGVMDIFRRRNFWITIGVFVPVQCCFMSVSINLAPLVISHGFSPTMSGLLLSSMSAAALAAKLASGMISDRLGNRAPLVLVALITACGVLMLAFSGHHLPMLLGAMIMIGLAGGIWTLLASATAAEFGAEGFGSAYGLISAFTILGSLAPPVLARIEELTGTYVTGLVGLSLFAVAGAVLGLFLKEKRMSLA